MASWGKGFLFYKVCILYVRPIFHFLKSKFTQSLLCTDFTKCTHSVSQSKLYTTTIYIFEASSGASEELGVDPFVAVSSNFWACVDSKLLHDAKLEEDMCTGMLWHIMHSIGYHVRIWICRHSSGGILDRVPAWLWEASGLGNLTREYQRLVKTDSIWEYFTAAWLLLNSWLWGTF